MMNWSVILSGFLLGAAGSLHCVGMCGPLSLVLPIHHLSRSSKFFSLLVYQFGRILTYSIFGFLFGIAGRKIYLAGYQQLFSLLLGLCILVFALLYFVKKYFIRISFLDHFYVSIRKLIGVLLKRINGPFSFLLLGMANGLLPCGMVYIALFATLSLTTIGDSIGFMAMFGAGTLPAMMMAAYALQSFKLKTRIILRNLIPYFIVLVGILLVLRGMNLGIPFLSPSFPKGINEVVECHT